MANFDINVWIVDEIRSQVAEMIDTGEIDTSPENAPDLVFESEASVKFWMEHNDGKLPTADDIRSEIVEAARWID